MCEVGEGGVGKERGGIESRRWRGERGKEGEEKRGVGREVEGWEGGGRGRGRGTKGGEKGGGVRTQNPC